MWQGWIDGMVGFWLIVSTFIVIVGIWLGYTSTPHVEYLQR